MALTGSICDACFAGNMVKNWETAKVMEDAAARFAAVSLAGKITVEIPQTSISFA